MTPRPDLLVVVAAVPLLLLAQSVALASATNDDDDCLSFVAAEQTKDPGVVFCGFPLPTGSGDLREVPLACERKVDKLLTQLKQEPGLQALTKDNICYINFTDASKGTVETFLRFQLVTGLNYPRPVRVRLLTSVSELVGFTPTLVIFGEHFSSINPSIFSAIGPTQKKTLKHLVLSNIAIDSLDLSMLEPLDISDLVLVRNDQLSRITNTKSVKLPKLRELVIWDGNRSLVDCRNFRVLPDSLTTIYLLQEGLEKNCAFCYLPKGVNKVVVKRSLARLPFYKSDLESVDWSIPFPLKTPYDFKNRIDNYHIYGRSHENVREFTIKESAVSGCQACSCQPASTPQPPASTPQPPASTPQPPASTPQPPASTPQPPASTPQPPASTPRSPTSKNSDVKAPETSSVPANKPDSTGNEPVGKEASSGVSGGNKTVMKGSSSSGVRKDGSRIAPRAEAFAAVASAVLLVGVPHLAAAAAAAAAILSQRVLCVSHFA